MIKETTITPVCGLFMGVHDELFEILSGVNKSGKWISAQ